MSDYPSAPPSNASYPDSDVSNHQPGFDASNTISPETPSNWWIWGIAFLTATALGFQIWSLLGMLGVEKQQVAFEAKVEAWYEGDKDRQKTIESWREIRTDLDDGVQKLRKQSAELEGTLESLRIQQDEASKKVETEQAILANLREARSNVESNLESAKTETLQLESRRSVAEKDHSGYSQKNTQLTQDIKLNEDRLETIKARVQRQLAMVESQTTKLSDVEKEIKTLEEFLDDRKTDAAKLQQEIQQQASLEKEVENSQVKLKALQTTIGNSQKEVDRLTAAVKDSTKRKGSADSELAIVQERLESLKAEEADLAERVVKSTSSLSEMSVKATEVTTKNLESFEQLARQAAKVTEALNKLRAAEKIVPAIVAEPAVPSVNSAEGDN